MDNEELYGDHEAKIYDELFFKTNDLVLSNLGRCDPKTLSLMPPENVEDYFVYLTAFMITDRETRDGSDNSVRWMQLLNKLFKAVDSEVLGEWMYALVFD